MPAAQIVNRPLATVNGEVILQSEFEKTYEALAADLQTKTRLSADRLAEAFAEFNKKTSFPLGTVKPEIASITELTDDKNRPR